MKLSFQIILLFAIIILAVVAIQLKNTQNPSPEDETAINTKGLSADEKQKLETFYTAFSSVLAADQNNIISTTNRFKNVHNESGILCYGDSLKGHPLVQRSINKYLNNAMSNSEDVEAAAANNSGVYTARDSEISAEQKAKLITALQGIADSFKTR